MGTIGAILAVLLMLGMLLEAFEAMILPRRVRHIYVVRFLYAASWRLWRALARIIPRRFRPDFLSFFGPLSILVMMAFWAAALIFSFALLHWSLDTAIAGTDGNFL